jgi:SH3 domain protein
MKRFRLIIPIALGLSIIPQASWATKVYVTDSFKVTLRTGPSIENRVIAIPSSGQSVEVLDSHGDWSHVRLLGPGASNKEGWMLSRFLVTRLPWETQARSLREENIRLKERLARIERRLHEAADREGAIRPTLEAAHKDIQRLTEETEKLRSSQRNKWFAMGALILLCGLLIGLVIGRQEKKRRSTLYS